MDFKYIDITNIPNVAISNEVVHFGKQGDETIAIESIAEDAGTIPYKITYGISNDVSRLYINE